MGEPERGGRYPVHVVRHGNLEAMLLAVKVNLYLYTLCTVVHATTVISSPQIVRDHGYHTDTHSGGNAAPHTEGPGF